MNRKSISVVLIASLAFGSSALAQQKQTFPFNGFNGSSPQGGLIADAAGNLYGTTFGGGSFGAGTVYEMSRSQNGRWTQTILYDFSGDLFVGSGPVGNLVFDTVGNLYGVTMNGVYDYGTVFELSPPSQPGGSWTETTLYSFSGGDDGGSPQAGLIIDQNGNLYGTALGGLNCQGGVGCGVVFEVSPPSSQFGDWTESALHLFTVWDDGAEPRAPLVFDTAGNLYGTTSAGGPEELGSVFELSPPSTQGGAWAETILHYFDGEDGADPEAGLVLTKSGTLLGTASGGGTFQQGVVFGLTPPANTGGGWHYGVIWSFGTAIGDGAQPRAGLTLQNGRVLFGTTMAGGSFGGGTVFQLTPPTNHGEGWTESILYSFLGGNDGSQPLSGVLLEGGALYGTTSQGGFKDNGTAFRLID